MRRALYILGELSDEDIVWLAGEGARLEVESGHVLIRAGEPVDTLYLVIDGQLLVTLPGGQRLAELGPGDIVGEMSLVEKRPPAVSVSSAGPCELLAVPHAALREALRSNLGLAARFYRALSIFLSDRLRGTVSRLGYGASGEDAHAEAANASARGLDSQGPQPLDELDEVVLDSVHLAGDRLRRLVELVRR